MDIRQQRCLVVGGGEVAARKVDLLLRAGARVRVVAPALAGAMRDLLRNPALQCDVRPYLEADLEGVALAVAATNDRALNAEVSRAARARGLPVNVVDEPELCSIIVPAIVDRSPVIVAIGTGGRVPVLARLLRGRIESILPQRYGELARLCANLRGEVQRTLPDITQRRRFWEAALEGRIAELVLAGDISGGERALRDALSQTAQQAPERDGEAYLVGAGPNDPELLSFRALRILQRAELVLFDASVSQAIVDLARRDAMRRAFSEPLANAEGVLAQLLAATQSGQRVCVLAVGDAFRQAPGLRFAERARALGVACESVPGVA